MVARWMRLSGPDSQVVLDILENARVFFGKRSAAARDREFDSSISQGDDTGLSCAFRARRPGRFADVAGGVVDLGER